MVSSIQYKNHKKRQNLHIKNFPLTWGEDDITRLFSPYGEIDSIKLDKSQEGNHFAFVCFKLPEASTIAKEALTGSNFDGKDLIINHYEIKEYRDLKKEEEQDQKDWDAYIVMQNGGLGAININSSPQMSLLIQSLLQMNINPQQALNQAQH